MRKKQLNPKKIWAGFVIFISAIPIGILYSLALALGLVIVAMLIIYSGMPKPLPSK